MPSFIVKRDESLNCLCDQFVPISTRSSKPILQAHYCLNSPRAQTATSGDLATKEAAAATDGDLASKETAAATGDLANKVTCSARGVLATKEIIDAASGDLGAKEDIAAGDLRTEGLRTAGEGMSNFSSPISVDSIT